MRTKTRGLFAKGKRILCTISHTAALIFKKIFAGFCVLNWRLLTRKPINSLNETNGIVKQFQWNRWTKSMVLLNEINGIVSGNWRFCGVNVAFVASKSDGEGGECWYMLVLESQQNSVCNGNGSGRGNSAWKPDLCRFTFLPPPPPLFSFDFIMILCPRIKVRFTSIHVLDSPCRHYFHLDFHMILCPKTNPVL